MRDMTLKSLYIDALARFDSQPLLHYRDDTYSYGEVVTDANRLANRLRAEGVGPGVPVAIMTSNCPEFVIADQAVLRCGAVKVALNDMLSAKDIEYILRDSKAHVAIADAGMLPAALAAKQNNVQLVIAAGDVPYAPEKVVTWSEALVGQPASIPEVDPSPDDLGLIMYTGGTTGQPKGVMHSQSSLVLNLLAHVIEMGILDDEVLLLMSPLPHSAGLLLGASMLKGASCYLEAKFDPDLVIERITRDKITYTFMVPTMIYRVLDHVAGQKMDLSSLRTILYGAAPITRERLTQGLEIFGPVFMQLYGQSEAPNFVTRLPREDHLLDGGNNRLSSCGQAAVMAQIMIVDEQDREVAVGEVGEIVARTPYNMVGYLGREEQTAKTLRGGWLHTGDLGMMDKDGYLYLMDRKNDMIITGGMNVYSAEVENAAQSCAGVAQVAVVGVPHPDWGEAIVAFVIPDSSGDFNDSALLAHCRRELAHYKLPKAVRVVDSLPTTAYGKVDKKALRASWHGW